LGKGDIRLGLGNERSFTPNRQNDVQVKREYEAVSDLDASGFTFRAFWPKDSAKQGWA